VFKNSVFKVGKINIPHIISNPEIVIYIFDDTGEFEKFECLKQVKE